MLAACKKDGQSLYYASSELRDDKEVVLAAVKNKPIILKYASLRLRDDKDVVTAALENEKKLVKDVVSYASDRLSNSDEIKKFLE